MLLESWFHSDQLARPMKLVKLGSKLSTAETDFPNLFRVVLSESGADPVDAT